MLSRRSASLFLVLVLLCALFPPFIPVAEATAPTIVNTNPADGSTNALINQNLVIQFSEVIDVQTNSIRIKRMSDDGTHESINVTSNQVVGDNTNVITIIPSIELDQNTEYFIEIDGNAFDDMEGNSFAGINNNTTWNFTTSTWYHGDWEYRQELTVDSSKVAGSTNHAHFPVLVSITDNDFRSEANGGKVALDTGADILFTDTSNNVLDFHMERYNPTTGEIIAWVRIASLSPNTDTTFHMYYGNSGASDQSNEDGVWNGASNYRVVHDFSEASGTILDSTDSNFDGTASGSPTYQQTGKIGYGMEFDGTDDYFEFASNPFFNDDLTMVAWIKKDDTDWGTVFSMTDICASGRSWERFNMLTRDDMYYRNKKTTNCDGGSVADVYESDATPISAGTWHQLAIVVVDNQVDQRDVKFYLDGTLYAHTQTNDDGYTHGSSGGQKTRIGAGNQQGGAYLPFDGVMDHLTYSLEDRSADWILTEYNNQNDPGTFVTFSGEVDNGGGLILATPSGNHQAFLAQDESIDLTQKRQTGTVEVRVFEDSVPVVDASTDLSQDRTYGSVTADVSGNKVAVNFTGDTGHSGGHNIYLAFSALLPQLRVCPDAENINEVSSGCSGGVVFNNGETKTVGSDSVTVDIITIDSVQYWRVSGITGSGAQSEAPGASAVPEWDFWMLLLLLIGCGVILERERRLVWLDL